jgi:hypothetical protein
MHGRSKVTVLKDAFERIDLRLKLASIGQKGQRLLNQKGANTMIIP